MNNEQTAKVAKAITKSTPSAGRLIFARMAIHGESLNVAVNKVVASGALGEGIDKKQLAAILREWSGKVV